MSFKILGIRALKSNPYLKNLTPQVLYKFTSDYEFKEKAIRTGSFNEIYDIENKKTYPQDLYDLKMANDKPLSVHITAIVGKNGSGKSTYWSCFTLRPIVLRNGKVIRMIVHLTNARLIEALHVIILMNTRLQVNNKLHEYLIYTDNIPFFYKYLNKEITIRYNPLDMDVIYLYPTDSFFHIATLNLHVNFPLAQVSQTEEDRNRIRDFSLKRYAMKKKLLTISKQSENKKDDEKPLPIELISEKYDSKELVTSSVKEYLLPKGKKHKKALKVNYNQTVDDSVPLINLSLGKMFNLPGSNKLIN